MLKIENLHAEIDGPGFRVLPGVAPLLDRLSGQGAAYGLCTGNVEAGARVGPRVVLGAGVEQRVLGLADQLAGSGASARGRPE